MHHGAASKAAKSAKVKSKAAVVTDDKSVKAFTPLETPTKNWSLTLSAGWDSRYMFFGLDQVAAASYGGAYPSTSGIWNTKISATWNGFNFGVGYIRAVERTNPRFEQSSKIFKNYSEIPAWISYTHDIFVDHLELSGGFIYTNVPEKTFWGQKDLGEFFAKLAYTKCPAIRPSIVFHKFVELSHESVDFFGRQKHVNLEGAILEARLDSTVPLITRGDVSVSLDTYISASYDFNYNVESQDWNGVEFGLALPITFKGQYTVSPYVRTGVDLGADHTDFVGSNHVTVPVWGGVQFSATY